MTKPASTKPGARRPAPPPPSGARSPAPLKRPAHRPPYAATEKDRLTVKVMVAGAIEQARIAGVLGITPKTLRKHFRREIDTGSAEVDGRVVASLISMATSGKNVRATEIWLEWRMGKSDRIVVAVDDPATLSDADIEARIASLRRSATVARAARPSGTT